MGGYDTDYHPMGLTIVITVGVAFGVAIGTAALDYLRSKNETKRPKKCKKLHVKPYNKNAYQQQPLPYRKCKHNNGLIIKKKKDANRV